MAVAIFRLGAKSIAGGMLLSLLSLPTGCHRTDALPKAGSTAYLAFTNAFYAGTAGLQVGDDARAEASLNESTTLAPGEPAAWVNAGILALRQRNFDRAAERLGRARKLAPQNSQVTYLNGVLEADRGNSAAAIPLLQEAVSEDGNNLRALARLAQEVERQGDADSDRRFQSLMDQVLRVQPGNLAAEVELARVSAKLGDAASLRGAVQALVKRDSSWPDEVKQQVAQLEAAANGPQPRMAATRTTFVRNVLMRVPEFRESLAELQPAPGEGSPPMMRFLRLPNLPATPAPADPGLHFEQAVLPGSPMTAAAQWAGALYLSGEGAPVTAWADGVALHLSNGASLPLPGSEGLRSPETVLAADLNYDFKNDLVLAGAAGVRIWRQMDALHFQDVTAATKLPAGVLNGRYSGAWAMDLEADGDLDVLLGSPKGQPTVLRNNGDGSFAPVHPFSGVDGLRQFAWADLNGDGNPDAALVDGAGRLHVFLNRRFGVFGEAALPELGSVAAVTVGDVGAGDTLSLIVLKATGEVVLLQTDEQERQWTPVHVLTSAATQTARMYAADLDNNGGVDLVISQIGPTAAAAEIWLQRSDTGFDRLNVRWGLSNVSGVADVRNDGRMALVGIKGDGAPGLGIATGSRGYHWQTIRPRARTATGDQRVNPFGIGGEIEVRSGLLVQKQPVNAPAVHFGLGEQGSANVARILWPNGSVRAEFNLKADQQIVTEQRLKGSCPFLFAWNGHAMEFVKDSVPWGSAIGLRIDALGSAKIAATEEWYRIGRDELAERDGYYDLRVTGELWESYFYDSLSLMTVDHPAGTEVYTDERYDVPPVKLRVVEVETPQPVLRAVDDRGTDVTAVVRDLDGQYLDTFGRGQYQGVTRDHWVELTLPDTLPQGPLWLIAKGWLHPSDSSVNVAMGQAGVRPEWLRMEVPDGRGGWRVANPNLGFPAGRKKICLFDLSGLWRAGEPHRLRLRTNLEVYWDQIKWARGVDAPMKTERLQPNVADLRYRGFSAIHQTNDSSPEIPEYNRVAGTSKRWRDLEGYYTRFGDVRELLEKTDDRSVVMNAGDELVLRFKTPAPPPAGWVRDFVLAGDGWVKDGDYNSAYSATVMPYPHHSRTDYDSAPGRLEEDWVYRRFPEDWAKYQTRYVAADGFRSGLK